jgi:hypothetical protein
MKCPKCDNEGKKIGICKNGEGKLAFFVYGCCNEIYFKDIDPFCASVLAILEIWNKT